MAHRNPVHNTTAVRSDRGRDRNRLTMFLASEGLDLIVVAHREFSATGLDGRRLDEPVP